MLRQVSEEQGRKVNHDYKVLDPLQRACNDIIFAHLYPRLDVEVSRKMNHLLKVGSALAVSQQGPDAP